MRKNERLLSVWIKSSATTTLYHKVLIFTKHRINYLCLLMNKTKPLKNHTRKARKHNTRAVFLPSSLTTLENGVFSAKHGKINKLTWNKKKWRKKLVFEGKKKWHKKWNGKKKIYSYVQPRKNKKFSIHVPGCCKRFFPLFSINHITMFPFIRAKCSKKAKKKKLNKKFYILFVHLHGLRNEIFLLFVLWGAKNIDKFSFFPTLWCLTFHMSKNILWW